MFFEKKGNTAALPYLERAVELDPDFAIAYRALGATYHNLHQPVRMAENLRKAYELREKVSGRERFYIESSYYWMGTEELEKAIAADELWRQSYPRDYALYVHLGVIYRLLGNLEKALEEARESVRLEPNSGINVEGTFRTVDPVAAGRAVLVATSRFHHPAHAAEWVDPAVDATFNDVWQLLMDGLRVAKSPG